MEQYEAGHWAGVFDSDVVLPGVRVTMRRVVVAYEIEIYSDDGGVTYLNEIPMDIRAGRVLVAKPGDVRYSRLPLRTHFIKLRDDVPKELRAFLDALPPYFECAHSAEYCASVRRMLRAEVEGDYIAGQAELYTLLAALRQDCGEMLRVSESSPSRRAVGAVAEAMRYMDAHYSGNCSLHEIAAAVHLSPVYFHSRFREVTGRTPFAYLMNLRIESAKQLLQTENIDMEQISERCGFSSQSYFSSVFRKATGFTPSAYRRQMMERYLGE